MKLLATDAALRTFAPLPLRERLFVRARRWSAPLEALAARAPTGAIVDVGCGHGALTALLAEGRLDRRVLGVDPDERKIAWARRGPGKLPNVELRVGTVEDVAQERPASFDAAIVSDVLYLLPVERWGGFIERCAALLRPGGRLLLKEAEGDGSWKHYKCLAQELVMVKLIGKTRGSGGMALRSRAHTEALIRAAGLGLLETVDLSRGYTTPHVLYVAQAVGGR